MRTGVSAKTCRIRMPSFSRSFSRLESTLSVIPLIASRISLNLVAPPSIARTTAPAHRLPMISAARL